MKSSIRYKTMVGAAVLVVALILIGVFFATRDMGGNDGEEAAAFGAFAAESASTGSRGETSGTQVSPLATKADISLYNRVYSDAQGRFSFKYPDGFTVRTASYDGTETVYVEKGGSQEAIQISISPVDDGTTVITEERILADIPDLTISEPTAVLVGSARGLEFQSDDPTFEDSSAEIWFIYKKNFYQVSTYSRFADFERGVVGTFNF